MNYDELSLFNQLFLNLSALLSSVVIKQNYTSDNFCQSVNVKWPIHDHKRKSDVKVKNQLFLKPESDHSVLYLLCLV